jgi:hypothetical protein
MQPINNQNNNKYKGNNGSKIDCENTIKKKTDTNKYTCTRKRTILLDLLNLLFCYLSFG